MTVFGELLAVPFVLDFLKEAVKIGYTKLKDINEVHRLLASYRFEKPIDDERSLYIHTLLLFESRLNQGDYSDILIKEDALAIFKNTYINGKDTSPFTDYVHKELKAKDIDQTTDYVIKILAEFFSTYESLIREVATPVQNEIINLVIDGQEKSQQQGKLILEAIQELKEDSPIIKEQIKFANKFIEDKNYSLALDTLLVLEKNFNSIKSNEHKSSILTNIGYSYYELGKVGDAHKYFKQAYEFNNDNYASICNYAQTLLHQGERRKANKLIDRGVTLFGNEHADIWEIFILTKRGSLLINDIIKQIPDSFLEEPNVLRGIAYAFRNESLIDDYHNTIKRAYELYPRLGSIKFSYIEAVLYKYQTDYKTFNIRNISKEVESDIHHHLQFTIELIKTEKDRTESKFFLQQARITFLYLLRQEQEALVILEEIESEYSLKHQKLYKLKALILFVLQKFDESIGVLEEHLTPTSEQEDYLMLIEIASQSNNLEILEKYFNILDSNENYEYRDQSINLLIDRYIKNKDNEKLTYWNSKIKEYSGLEYRITEARILQYFESPNLELHLSECLQQVNEKTKFRLVYQLTEIYENAGSFDKAITLLEPRLEDLTYDNLTGTLIRLIERHGDTKKLIELLNHLRKKNGLHETYCLKEINILYNNYQYKDTISLAEKYLEIFPNRTDILIFVAMIRLKIKDFQNLDEFLDLKIDYMSLSYIDLNNYLAMLAYRNKGLKCLDIIYEYHRSQNSPQSNDLYLTFCLKFNILNNVTISDVVADNSYVVVFDGIRDRMNMLIENRPSSDLNLSRNEISTYDNLCKTILGQKVGFEFMDTESFIPKTWFIESIDHKYIYQFKQCQSDAKGIFKREGAIKAFHIDDLMTLFKSDSPRVLYPDPIDEVLSYYKNAEAGIGIISEALNKNPIKTRELILQKGLDIKASYGIMEELKPIATESSEMEVVLDITSILTLFDLGLLDKVTKSFKNLIITQTTYDVAYEYLQENQYAIFDGITLNNSPLLKAFNTYFSIENPDTLGLNKDERERMYKEYGTSFYDSALLSKQKDCLLISDDFIQRAKNSSSLNVETSWTMPLLKHLKEHDIIEEEDYHNSVIKLIESKYSFISFNEHTLMHCLKQENYHATSRFINLTKLLSGNISTIKSAINTTTNFLALLINSRRFDDNEILSLSSVMIGSVATDRNLNDLFFQYAQKIEDYSHNKYLYRFLKLIFFHFSYLHRFKLFL